MNDSLTANPILHFRNSGKANIPLPDGVFNLVSGVHLDEENRFEAQTNILVNSTLITETREAVDSSEHSY